MSRAQHLALTLFTLWCTENGFRTDLQAGELLEGDRYTLTPTQLVWLETWDKLWEELQ